MTQIVCANCGQALRPTDKFCYNCGAKVQPIKMKPEVEKEVPKPEPVKAAPSVFKTQVQPRPEAPKPVQEERPKFHMDEAMSWNTDGYPDAQRHPVQNPEEADFSWDGSTAQDRIKKRQEEGRETLFEEKEVKEAAEAKAEAEAAEQFSETPEAEEGVKAGDAESTIPVEEFKVEAHGEAEEVPAEAGETAEEAEAAAEEAYKAPEEAEETPAEQEAAPEIPAAEAKAEAEAADQFSETPEAEEEIKAADAESTIPVDEFKAEASGEAEKAEAAAEEAYKAPEEKAEEAPAEQEAAPAEAAEEVPVPQAEDEAEADDDYVVPTIEAIEKDAEAIKARETEKEIFGYTLDDIDSGARAEGSSGAEVIDKFYTYSKKNEEFQALLDQENEKLKGNRSDDVKPASDIKEELEKATAQEEAPKEPVDTGGFVGVQLPETTVEAYEGSEPEASQDDAYKAPSVEEPKEFLDGNFGKADDIARNAGNQADEDKTAAANTVAAAAGAVAAGAAAIAAAREKARAKIEAEKSAVSESAAPEEAAEAVSSAAQEVQAEVPSDAAAGDKPFGEVITEESEKEREKSLAEEAEEAARAKAAEIKAAEEAAQVEKETPEEAEAHIEEAQKTIDAVIEETAAPAEKAEEEKAEEDRKLTYQDVFNEETEKTPKHTFLKIIAILILLLIILEVAAILIRRFAPDSAAGIQIQQAYEMIFSRFI